MKKIFWLTLISIAIILIIIVILGYNYNRIVSREPEENEYENYYDYFVSKVRYEQKVIEKENNSDEIKPNIDFKKYFNVFDKLSVEKGWNLDCYYYKDTYSGRPVFFARKVNNNRDSLVRKFQKQGIFDYCDLIKTSEHITLKENNTKGLYQLLIFEIIGSDFAKSWHSNYGNNEIICSRKALLNLVNTNDEYHDFDRNTKRQMKKVDLTPIVSESNDTIKFRLLSFNSWSGLSENVFSINKKFPHKVKMIANKLLVEYNCKIIY